MEKETLDFSLDGQRSLRILNDVSKELFGRRVRKFLKVPVEKVAMSMRIVCNQSLKTSKRLSLDIFKIPSSNSVDKLNLFKETSSHFSQRPFYTLQHCAMSGLQRMIGKCHGTKKRQINNKKVAYMLLSQNGYGTNFLTRNIQIIIISIFNLFFFLSNAFIIVNWYFLSH